MKNRVAATIFLILANLVLFVHAVIPHHHHESELCFDAFNKTEQTTDNCCESDETKHHHDSDKDEDGCFLTHIIALNYGEVKQGIRVDFVSAGFNTNNFAMAILSDRNSAISSPDYFIEIISHDRRPNYFSLACRASGLRAPPFSV